LPLVAFIDIIVLLAAIVLTMMKFYKISKVSLYLLIPYLLWVSFATILNMSIVLLNR
ncbi:tryptophan-rich sensory protein, partial [Patescibacteria group bacterium]|nr:tryptophan-rich sensory protein [Patescibacteria group bacterium]